jgi:hypothetical protein
MYVDFFICTELRRCAKLHFSVDLAPSRNAYHKPARMYGVGCRHDRPIVSNSGAESRVRVPLEVREDILPGTALHSQTALTCLDCNISVRTTQKTSLPICIAIVAVETSSFAQPLPSNYFSAGHFLGTGLCVTITCSSHNLFC